MEFSSKKYFTGTLLCYIFTFRYYHLLFCCKINILHFENVENLISAHLELAPTLKVQKFNKRPGARFSKVPIINGPGKLSPFTLKIEVSIVLHLTRQNCQLMKQNALVC